MSRTRWLDTVVLDFDGVIVDSMRFQENAWKQAARQVGIQRAVEERLVRNLYLGAAGSQIFAHIDLSVPLKLKLRVAKDRLWEVGRREVPLFHGAATALPRLATLFSIGIATTAPREHVDDVLRRERLAGSVSAIATNQDARKPKPHPELLLDLILGPLKAQPASSVMVGDTETDRQMAKAAGVPFLLFDPAGTGATRAETTVKSWCELEKLLAQSPGV